MMPETWREREIFREALKLHSKASGVDGAAREASHHKSPSAEGLRGS